MEEWNYNKKNKETNKSFVQLRVCVCLSLSLGVCVFLYYYFFICILKLLFQFVYFACIYRCCLFIGASKSSEIHFFISGQNAVNYYFWAFTTAFRCSNVSLLKHKQIPILTIIRRRIFILLLKIHSSVVRIAKSPEHTKKTIFLARPLPLLSLTNATVPFHTLYF